ncbi:TPA: hypothetical protein ACJ3GQ_002220 [Neisseria meningitidis]
MHFENEIEHKILVTYVIAKVSNYDTFKRAVWQTLGAYYCVCNYGDGLEIASNRPDGYAVRIVFGDVPV